MDFIEAVEKSLGKKAEKNFLQMQPGDVPATWANVDDLVDDFGYAPSITVEEGIDRFVKWYLEFFNIH
jgi:UDP-glucuronate 4-epimerase